MAQIQQFSGLGMYDEGGKFDVDSKTVERLRAEAEEQGLIFSGDATAGQKLSEFIRNAPDAAYSFLARGTEGIAELATGLALATYKGGRLATETDPEKLKEIMAEPAFTKYLGEFRGALGNLNLGENRISGLSPEEIAGVIGYYTAPVPTGIMAAGARAVPTLVKGAGQVADELATTARFFPEYNPLRKFQPKSVGAMSIDDLIEGGQLKKASEITDDPLTLMARERDRFQKIVESKAKRFPIQMGGPEKKLIKGVDDTAEDVFSKADQKIIDEIDIVSGFKDADKTPSYATPEKKKLTLKLLEIAKNDKSNEAFGVKFQNAYKNYVLGEDAVIPKNYFRSGFKSYKKTAQNILNYKKEGSADILNIPNPNTVRVSADGTKVTQMKGVTGQDPKTLFNNIEVGQPVTGDAKKRLRTEILVGDDTKNFREVKDELTKKDKNISSKIDTLKNLFEDASGNVHVYSIDHIQPPRFGGSNTSTDNLTFIMEGPHNNLQNLPKSKTLVDDVVKPKSRFEDEVYKRSIGLVDAVSAGNVKRAEELSKEIFNLQNNFKKTFTNIDFTVGQAYIPIKTGDKSAKYVKYGDQVGLNDEQKKLVENLLPTYSNKPNQGVGIEESIDKIITIYGQMASLKGGKLTAAEAGQMSPMRDGGIVGMNYMTRPLV